MNLFIFACQGCPGWQQVDAVQEEVEEEDKDETESREEILEALGDLGKVRAITVAKAISKDRSNTHKLLVELWKKGKCHRELIDNQAYYFIEDQHE